MWKGSEDPGGGPPEGGSKQSGQGSQLEDLKDQFEQQQLLISQLKEIIKKSDQTTVTQEKVAEYANTLTKMKSRAKRHGLSRDTTEADGSKMNTPASEKIMLLRQQLEENKVKLAERGKNQKGIEEMVAQVKAQLDDSQQQINLSQTPLNISLIEDRVDYTPQLGSQELYNILLNKDRRLSELNTRMSKMQATILDLQENLKEKDSVIDARTKAITLMSENLSKKGKTTLDALDETKEQMRNMQENFIQLEEQLKGENASLQSELQTKANEVQRLRKENEELLHRNNELQQSEEVLQLKVAELEKGQSSQGSSPARRSPSKTRKGKKGKSVKRDESDDSKMASMLEQQIQQMDAKCAEYIQQIKELSQNCTDKDELLENMRCDLQIKEDKLEALTSEFDKLRESSKSKSSVDSETDMTKLKQQLDEANKNMIKVKAQHKSKVKELNKKIDAFKKISDVNAELVKMENENSKLQLRVAELEDEKGQFQLTMVESKESTSLDDLEHTVKELTAKLDENKVSMDMHEAEKLKSQEAIDVLQGKLEQLTAEGVKSQLTTVQFEEQMEDLEKAKTVLEATIHSMEEQIAEANNQIEALKKEKSEIQHKYENLLQENAELIDRLEKLSTEKVSSAESIEIVENLTQQEKLELEAYQKSLLPKTSNENLDENPDLNDSVNQLTEETSELLQKIELFTVERREVMEKLELLNDENNQLSLKLKEVENNRDVLAETYEQLQTEKEVLDSKLEEYEKQIKQLSDVQINASHESSADIAEYKNLIDIQKEQMCELKLKLLSYENHDHNMHENEELEAKYLQMIADNEELNVELSEVKECNKNFTEIIEENKLELIKYAQLIENNKQLQQSHELLEQRMAEVQKELKALHKMNEDFTNSTEEYEIELNKKCDVIKNLEHDIKALKEETLIIQNVLAEKVQEIECVSKEKQEKQLENEKLLKAATAEKNSNNFEIKVKELEGKNKEQLEKMKKIAAILKKKSAEYKELEAKYNELKQVETEKLQKSAETNFEVIQNLESQLQNAQSELELFKKEIKVKEEECAQLLVQQNALVQENNQVKSRNDEITNQLQIYSSQIEELQKVVNDYEIQMNAQARELDSLRAQTNESLNNAATIGKLQEEIEALTYNSQSSSNALQMKIHEQEMCIENQELELQKHKEQVANLEESLATAEEHRERFQDKVTDMERAIIEKDGKLRHTNEKNEMLEERLNEIMNKHKLCTLRNEEIEEENLNAQKEIQKLHDEIGNYKKQVNHFNEQLCEYETSKEALNALEAEKQTLDVKTKTLENEIKKLNAHLSTIQSETERNDTELQEQLEIYANERKQLMGQVEIAHEELTRLNNQKEEMEQTISSLNNKLDQQQLEFEETIKKYHELQQEYKKALSQLEQQDTALQMREEQNATYEDIHQMLQIKLDELSHFKATYVPSPADFFSENPVEAKLHKEISDLQARLDVKQQQTIQDDNHLKERIELLERELQEKMRDEKEIIDKLEIVQKEIDEREKYVKQSDETIKDLKTQLDFARNMIEQVEENNFQTLNRNNELEQTLQRLHDEKRTEQETASVISLETMAKSEAMPLQGTSTDLDKQRTFAEPVENSNTSEELQQKIKTLEFMLYNTEQEKEHALIQCAQLSEELGRFIYEKEQLMTTQSTSAPTSNVESQIMSTEDIAIPLNVPHEPSKLPQECSSSDAAISEDVCLQKEAYECTPSVFADDDGWGLDIEDVKLSESRTQGTSSSMSLVGELEEKIRLLKLEKDAHLEELHQANVKCGKLIKKLREFKAKNEQLTAQLKTVKSSDDFGLEDAIVDELKSQIAMLEKKIKEVTAELDKERIEKEQQVKKVDVLTSANDRLIEMKEKQDIEVHGYQQQARELRLKLEKVEWTSESNDVAVSSTYSPSHGNANTEVQNEDKIRELNDMIKELQLDNEELQAMLEEQMKMRKEAENTRKSVSGANDINEAQLVQLIEEKTKLISQIAVYENEKETMIHELASLKEPLAKACADRDILQEDLKQITDKLHENYKEKTQLEATILENGILVETLKKTIDDLNVNLQEVEQQSSNSINEEEFASLRIKLEAVEQEVISLQSQLTEVQKERTHYEAENITLQATIDGLKCQKDDLQEQNRLLDITMNEVRAELQQNVAVLEQETSAQQDIEALKKQLLEQQSEFESKLTSTTAQLAQEWSQYVEQRGNDVAESWKLHVDTRESEFAQLERELRKELADAEEKCNTLVNENNELRRNVDAEIRNEVDRISALQQQINDRQIHITTLSKSMQQKDAENAQLLERLAVFEERIKASDAQLQSFIEAQNEKDQTIADLGRQLQDARDNKTAEEVMDQLRVELTAKDNEIIKCKNTIEELTANLAEFARMQARLEELTQDKERTEKLKTKLDEATLQFTTLHGTLQEKEHRLKELEAAIQQQQADEASAHQLQSRNHELEQQIANYVLQLHENNLHINSLNEEIESFKALGNHAQTKDAEIQRLNHLLDEKQRDYEYAMQNQLLESESVLSTQRQEMDSLRRMLNQEQINKDEQLAELDTYKEQLNDITQQLTEYQTAYAQNEQKLANVSNVIQHYDAQIVELQRQIAELNAIIESQVLKIEELHREVYEKSSNYDALVSELSTAQELKKSVQPSETSSAHETSSEEQQQQEESELVPRAQLDLAMYMWHQRDVRCEELTVELMSLLEERDTLQLRLSNALREKEDFKGKYEATVTTPISMSATNTPTTSAGSSGKTKAIILGATGTEMATEAKEGLVEGSLATKLSQLKGVGYKKDKTLVDEQEWRQLQQMAMLEQHKDEVSKLPAEARAKLLDASYTLSRDVQSPSKVLLNWLWGKSTPKVNNV